jgi:hypothetical protein
VNESSASLTTLASPALARLLSQETFWQTLASNVSAHAAVSGATMLTRTDAFESQQFAQLCRDGYFQADAVVPRAQYERIASLMNEIARSELPTVFVFAYEDVWALACAIAESLSECFDRDYAVVPDFWAYSVGGRGRRDAGWRAHRDGKLADGSVRADGVPEMLNCWLALTDAGLHDACMNVVSTRDDPHLRAGTESTTVNEAMLRVAKQLPVKAGAVLGWNQLALHWGGEAAPDSPGRKSLAFYVGERTYLREKALRYVDASLALEDRLHHIYCMLWHYQHYESCAENLMKLAKAHRALAQHERERASAP